MIIGAGQQFPRNNSHCKLLCHFESDASDSSVGHTDTHTPTVNGSPSYGAGKFGNCIDFGSTNTDKYVTFPDSEDWDIPEGMPATISFWTYINTAKTGAIIDRYNSGSTNTIINIFINTTATPNRIGLTFGSFSSYYEKNLDVSTWYHIAICYDGSTVYLFLNGEMILTGASTGAVSDKQLVIANRRELTAPMTLKLDELTWIKGECLWTRNFTPPNRAS